VLKSHFKNPHPMRRKIPSTAALAAFEAAARHGSFTRAADELAVTQSAICRQIGALESFTGVKLFRRGRRGVLLTEAGARYSRAVRARLDAIERDTLDLIAQVGGGATLELAVVPTFASRWLLPRLPDFVARHPGITLNLTPRTRPFLFDDSGLDAAIHAGNAPWPGSESQFLMHEALVAVASPALRPGHRRLRPADLARLPLLQMATRPYAWRQWFASLGLQVPGDLSGPRMELFSMLTEAAIQGLGAALIPRMLIEAELSDGRLVVLVDHAFQSDRDYRLIYPEHKADLPALQRLKAWLATQVPPDGDLKSAAADL
jgi:LysR family glycine cleavage system transcriptional activator